MKNTILSIGYALSLFVSVTTHSAESRPFQAAAEEQARQSVAVARQQIREELEQSMRTVQVTLARAQAVLTGGTEVAKVTRIRSVAAE